MTQEKEDNEWGESLNSAPLYELARLRSSPRYVISEGCLESSADQLIKRSVYFSQASFLSAPLPFKSLGGFFSVLFFSFLFLRGRRGKKKTRNALNLVLCVITTNLLTFVKVTCSFSLDEPERIKRKPAKILSNWGRRKKELKETIKANWTKDSCSLLPLGKSLQPE